LLNQLKISISSSNGQPNATLADWIATYHTKLQQDSLQLVMSHNPVYVLRNSMAQQAIELAEQNDMSEVNRLYQLLANPYQVSALAKPSDTEPPLADAPEICVSCSS
jgi:uncharacterized protein YdiU (UPF0061 family)